MKQPSTDALSDASPAPLVSVVTPVYNGAKYLRECIESVLSQTYTNWEYIISDNCSTDETAGIAGEYAATDSRIKVVKNTEFLPIMPNWNRALRLISPNSRFCKIVHADDLLYPNCIEAMVSVALRDERIGIVGAYRMHGDRVDLNWLPPPDEIFPGRVVCRRNLMWRPDIFGSPSNTMIRSDIVRARDPFYDETDIHADTSACFEIMKDYDFGYVRQVLTLTRTHSQSVTSSVSVLNTQQAAKYCRLVKFGPEFMTPEQYAVRYRALKQRYYQMLVSRYLSKVVMKKERHTRKEFCAYHKRILEQLGEKLDIRQVLRALLVLIRNKASSLLKRS